ncbi:MAG: hypothetical protein ABFD49_06385 [Armatimonadota bacterium]|nr:hypothetical protein [bacterium]
MSIFDRLQKIDRRILYVLLALVIVVPLVRRPGVHPHIIAREVSSAYKTLDNASKNKIVVLSTTWSASTQAENGPQTEALMRHLFKNGTKFVLISWDPVGSELTYRMGSNIAKEMGKKYGRDWVHLGYTPYASIVTVTSGMGKDFQRIFKRDRFNTKLSNIPVTANVKDYNQIGAVADITGTGSLPYWMAYFSVPNHVPLIFCTTAVGAAEAYPYLDSGQVAGMLNGVIGASQYETLLGMENVPTYSVAASWALSAAHIYIIALIVLGNIGYLVVSRSSRGGRRNG